METSAGKEEGVTEAATADSELLASRDQTPRDQVDVNMETGDAKYKSGEFQQAIDAYKKAIEGNCQDAKLKTTLYTKKAQSYFQLGNYRQTLDDAKRAREVDSSNMEAIIIGTKTLLELQDIEQALAWCDEGLLFDHANKVLKILRARLLHQEKTNHGLEDKTSQENSEATTEKDKEIKRLKAILRKCQQTEDKAGEGRAYRKLGKAYNNTGQFRRAVETLTTGLEMAKEVGFIEGQADACIGLAKAYHDLGEFEKAVDFNTQSLVLVVRLNDKEGEGRVCFNLANTHCNLCNYKQATKYYRRSIDVFKIVADKESEEVAYSGLGVMYFKVGRFSKAIECHKVCLDIAKQTSNKIAEERAYCNLGVVHRSMGDFKQALNYLHSNLELVKESRIKAKECDAYNNLGDVYHSLCNYNEAINYRQQSLEAAKELRDRLAEGRAYSGLGIAYDCLGNVQKALEYQSRSLEIAIELNDKEGQQRAYGNLGIAHKHVGDIKQAIECYNHFLRIAKETGNKAAEGRAYANLGNAYRTLGNIEQALKYGKMHLEFAKGVGDKAGEGNAYSNLGIAYRHLNDLKNALECHQRHLDIAKKIGSRVSEGRAYCNLGNVYSTLGNLEKAIECYKLRLDISKEVGNRAGEGLANGNLGDAYYHLGDYEQALEHGKLYLNIAREVGDKTAEARSNFNCGRASEAQGCIENAIDFYKESVNGFDKLRSLLKREDEWKISLRNQYQEAYTALWSLLLNQERILEALFAAEKGRAQALEDLLKYQYGFVGDVAGVDPVTFSDINVTESTVVYVALEEDFINTWVIKKGTSVRFKRTGMNSQYLKVHGFSDLSSLIDRTIEEIGSSTSIRCEDRSFGAEERDEDSPEVVGKPSVSEGNSYPSNKGEVAETKLTSHSQCDTLLNVLHNLTIAPIEDLIIDNDLIIIPDGPLFLAPFAAFLNSGARFLFESYRIRVLPSLFSLKLILTSQPGYHRSSGALIVGDPDVDRIVKKSGRTTVKLLRPLPSARKEAEMIARILDTTPLIGEKATKEEVLLRLNTVAMIHIAAHGNSTTGEIALAPKPLPNLKIPEKDDYLLSMAEVLNVGLRARLVVLSCCHSGRGQIKAEGVVGIARAFLGAGARSVLVSLWAIDDDATLEFMQNFYQQLTKGKLASEALNESMKSLKESQKYNALKYWAPFVLIGDDVSLSVGGNDEAGDVEVMIINSRRMALIR